MCIEDLEQHVDCPKLRNVVAFVERENAFVVMGELKRLGILSSEDVNHAGTLNRKDWLDFMFEKIGIGGL